MEKTRLLIIDDDELLVGMIQEYFLKDSSIDVALVANDGNEGICLIENHFEDFDFILLDLIMPKKDGIDVLKYLQKNSYDKKVIVLTSYSTPNIIHKVATLGANYFMIKPFELSYLKEKIQLLRESEEKDKIINLIDYNLYNSISRTLHELGVPSHIKGYQYIREGITIIIEKGKIILTKDLYNMIAMKYDSTVSNVERSIRHAIEISWNRGNWELMEDLFGHSIDSEKAKPTNREFIITIVDRLQLETL